MIDLIHAIGRVRRAMPRNADVMLICDALERALASKPPAEPSAVAAEPSFDKTGYQRDLMRKRRKAAKAAKAG